jgi:hypothetical protein
MPKVAIPSYDPALPLQRVMNADVGAPPSITPVSKIFYSPVRELYIGISPGRLQTMSNGTVERTDEKFVRFQPLGDMYGIYKTNDPVIIEALERRMEDAKGAGVDPDVITEEEYGQRHLTDDVKLHIANREVESKNRLLLEQVRKNKELMEELERFRQAQQAMEPSQNAE